MQIKCQNDFPCPASITTCRPFRIKQGKCLKLSLVSSFPNSLLFLATYGMSLDQASFNQKAYLWKQRGTITHGQPWQAPSSFTTTQLVPSLSRVNKFNVASSCLFSCFLNFFFPLNSQEEGFEFFVELINQLYIFNLRQTQCEIQERLKQHIDCVVSCCTWHRVVGEMEVM